MDELYKEQLQEVLSIADINTYSVAGEKVKSVIENISPSIASIFLPLVAKAITGDNTLYDMRVYRFLYPPMLIAGFLISIIIYE